MGSNKTKTGTYVDSQGRIVIVGGGRYTPGGTGRNASTGDRKERKQTIPRVKKSQKAQTGAEASRRAQARRESGNIPKVQQTNNVPKTVKPSTRYADQSVVTTQSNKATTGAEASQRARAKREGKYTNPQANRDTRFDKDFNNFYEYRYEKADYTDYNPKNDTYTEHWRNLKEDIKKKNNWSDREFETRWKAYDTARRQSNAESEVNSAIDIAKKHPVLGTLLQAAYTPQTMIEGAAGMITSLLPDKYKAQRADSTLYTGTRAKEAIKQTVKDEHINSGIGKGAYDIGTGLGDMVLGTGVPVLGTASLGAQTAARQNMQALERGVDPNKAAKIGALSGLVSGAANKVGFDWLMGGEAAAEAGKEAAKITGKELAKRVATGAGKEALENVTEDALTLAIDKGFSGDKSQLNVLHDYYVNQGLSDNDAWKRVAVDTSRDLGMSAASGAAFGGLLSGVQNIPKLMDFRTNRAPQTDIPALAQKYNGEPTIVSQLGDSAPKNDLVSSTQKSIVVHDLPDTPEADGFIPTRYSQSNGILPIDSTEHKNIYKLSGRNTIINDGSNYEKFIDDAINNRFGKDNTTFYIGRVSPELANDLSASLGEDFSNSNISLDSGHARHFIGKHSDPLGEVDKYNQLPISKNDVNHINRAFDNPDTIGWRNGTDSEGNPVFRIAKRVDDVYYVVGGVRKGSGRNNEISIDTFYKSKKNPRLAGDTGNASPGSTSETDQALSGSLSNSNILNGSRNVNLSGYNSARQELDNLFNEYTDVARAGGVTDSDWRDILNSTSEIAAKYGDDPDYQNITELASQKLGDFNAMVQAYKNAPKVEAPRVDNALKNVDNGYEWVDPNSGVSVKGMLDSLRSDLDSVSDVHPTTQKNVDYLKGSIDRLENAYKTGDNFNEAYDDYRKALNRVKDNMAKKEGDTSWQTKYKTLLNLDNPDNIANRFKRLSSADNFDDADLPFNDDYKNLPDADGLGHRQGVNIDIRNMDDGVSRDRLIAEQRISKVRSNTLENAGLDNAEELKNVIPEEDFSYISRPEQVTYEAAISQLDNDWNGSVARYTADYNKDTISDIRSAQDVDAMMLAHQRLNEAARNATDPVEKARLYEESRKIALNLRKAGTGAGQQIQAFAKWTRTPEGAVTSAQGFAEEMVENGLKGNPKMANEIKDVTNEISSFLDEMDESAMTRQEIEDMIRDAISRRAQLRKRVTNGDIRKIADAILNDRQYADIQKELEYLATGYEDVDAETLEQVQDIFERAYDLDFNSKERVDLENEAYKLLANKIVPNGGSFRDKLDAWRYLAMLANPTTHIKNITGNELFGQGMVSAKNAMAALLEEGADRVSKATGGNGIERTKAILTTADKDLIDAANNDALQNAYRELSGNKYYSTGEGIDKAIQPFSNKKLTGRALNKAAEFNTNLLNAEDEMAVIAKYRTSLAGFLKANGADASIFNATDNASKSLLESGRQYAINQAKEAAFHQDSAVTSWLSGISRTARESNSNTVKALGFAGDIVVPFKKTPINILKSAIEYSPAEYIKVATDIPKLNKGLMKPAEFIDDISKATTGTAALGIGALLAHEGILKIGSSKSDEEQAFDKNTGRQNVAIKAGNKYIGMSELIPAAAPLILGATIFETMADSKGDENALNTIFSGMSAVANGVTDMTMLSGIADTLNSIRFAKDKSEVWQKLGIDTMSNLASQMLPTLGRKIETTIDDTKRSTYSDQTGALKTIDQELKYLQTKIPGLQQAGEALQGSSVPFLQAAGNRLALEPNIDVKGQVQNSPGVGGMDNALGRVINNFISPVPITEDQSTVYDDERRRLAEATGETAVLPYIASKEATIDDIQLTPEEWTQYRQARGQMREDVATNMIDSDFYKNASDADKVKLLTDIDTFTKNYSQSKYGKALSGPDQKLAEIYEKEGTQGLIKNFIGKDIAASVDLSSNSKVAERIQSAVNNNDLKTAQAIASDTGIITGAGLTPSVADAYQDAKQRIPSLTANNYVAMFKKVDKDGNGSLKQDEIIDAMNRDKKNASTYEKAFWTSDSKKPQKVDGQYKATSTKSGKSKGKTEGKSAKENNKDRIKELNGGGDIQSQLASYGAIDSETTVKYYNHAKQTIPSLTPKGYAQKLHEIGGDDYKITQKEMLSYANNKGLSEDDMSKYWNAYGQWKRIPYLSGGTWKAK